MLPTILLVILVLALLGTLPVWPYSRSWGYSGTSILGVILVVLILSMVFGWF